MISPRAYPLYAGLLKHSSQFYSLSAHASFHVDSGVLSDTKSTVVDGLVIFISVVSIFLCARSLLYSVYLCKTVFTFFIKKFSWRLKAKHLVPLFNLWFVGLIVSNGLVLVGSIMKLVISYTVSLCIALSPYITGVYSSCLTTLALCTRTHTHTHTQNPDSIALVDITSIILGLAVFGQWCGLLRFLSYFDKYNMLLITLRLALPSVMRFIICAGILYISFLLCGWLVLGPYNPKVIERVKYFSYILLSPFKCTHTHKHTCMHACSHTHTNTHTVPRPDCYL